MTAETLRTQLPHGERVTPDECFTLVMDDGGRVTSITPRFHELFAPDGQDNRGARATALYNKYVTNLGKDGLGARYERWQAKNGFRPLAKLDLEDVVTYEQSLRAQHNLPLLPI